METKQLDKEQNTIPATGVYFAHKQQLKLQFVISFCFLVSGISTFDICEQNISF